VPDGKGIERTGEYGYFIHFSNFASKLRLKTVLQKRPAN
jgi:hypothetical protein